MVVRKRTIVLLSSLLLLSMVSWVYPQQPARLTALEQRKAELEKQIEDARVRAEQLSRDESRQAEYLNELGTQVSASEQLINTLTRQIRASSAEASQLQEEIAGLDVDMEVLDDAVSAYIVGLYKHGRRRPLEIVLGSGTFTDAVKRLKGVTILAARQRDDVVRLGEIRDLRVQKRADVARSLNQQQQSRTEQTAARNNLRNKRQEAQALLEEISSDIVKVREGQEQAQEELSEILNSIEQLQAAAEAARQRNAARGLDPNIPLGGFAEMQGRLPWPLSSPGTVVREFGRQQGRDNTVTNTPGIDILAPGPNTSILAVHNAEVIHIGWLNFLGTVIILDHGDSYATVYTNATDPQVGVGDTVPAGFPMATVGTDMPPVAGEEAGYLMRFMISVSGNSIDPAPWLGGAR
ncbi:murein hydrolase activator EnvC family protein [Gemmatimonadota bacterium]